MRERVRERERDLSTYRKREAEKENLPCKLKNKQISTPLP
jgi:hypothetical protein